jgi:OOP family OmpA-OmpF porin
MRSILILLLLLSFRGVSQNLVDNPTFELNSDCPKYLGQFFMANGWNSPSLGTPDYFNDCSPSYDYGTEFNKKGGQVARSGHAYMGIQVSDLHRNLFYEYLETKLNNPLVAGQQYCVRMFVSMGGSDCGLKSMGIAFSQNVIRTMDAGRLDIPNTPLTNQSSMIDTTGWVCLTATYTAKGGENFLTIGNFQKDNPFIRVKLNAKLDDTFFNAYYFIDDVSVMAIKEPGECKCTEQ